MLKEYLNCPCQFFPPMQDDKLLLKAYQQAQEEGKKEGFIPVLVAVSECLLETLIMNVEDCDEGTQNKEEITDYRQRMLTVSLKEGKEVLDARISDLKDEMGEYWEEVLGEMQEEPEDSSEQQAGFEGYWDYGIRQTHPVLLAQIPVQNPWEVFAYLPFGGWNECPDTEELMSVAKYWFNQYGAVPALLSSDVLEFTLPAPITKEQARQVALEQYGFCADIVDQGTQTISKLENILCQSKIWFFWWD